MDQIIKEYEDIKNDSKFREARERMLYLHDKLAHVKSLVIEFNKTHPRKSSISAHYDRRVLST